MHAYRSRGLQERKAGCLASAYGPWPRPRRIARPAWRLHPTPSPIGMGPDGPPFGALGGM